MPALTYDIAVIGGGVVGLAILRRFAMAGLHCLLLEKGADILSGASKGNSALLHTGFDAPHGSLELQCIQSGYREYLSIREGLNLPLLETSAIVVGWTDEEMSRLPLIVDAAHRNGVLDVRLLSRDELRKREPRLAEAAHGGALVPGEHVIDPWSAPLAYARQALACGAVILRNSEVLSAVRVHDNWRLETTSGHVAARTVVNSAGLHGDRVEGLARPSPFTIRPRKGQFVVFDKSAHELVQANILPVPSDRTKGIVLFRTIFGNLAVGPTADETEERDNPSCDSATLQHLRSLAVAMVPELHDIGINAVYAGLRPATEKKDYIIEALPRLAWITVAGIRSTGLTASLGIAEHVARLYDQKFESLKPRRSLPTLVPVPNLAEHRARAYQSGDEIVCHCERVTRGEIEAALGPPLPAIDLGGLKRRTRAAMGRCQGFNCGAEIRSMLEKAHHGRS